MINSGECCAHLQFKEFLNRLFLGLILADTCLCVFGVYTNTCLLEFRRCKTHRHKVSQWPSPWNTWGQGRWTNNILSIGDAPTWQFLFKKKKGEKRFKHKHTHILPGCAKCLKSLMSVVQSPLQVFFVCICHHSFFAQSVLVWYVFN